MVPTTGDMRTSGGTGQTVGSGLNGPLGPTWRTPFSDMYGPNFLGLSPEDIEQMMQVMAMRQAIQIPDIGIAGMYDQAFFGRSPTQQDAWRKAYQAKFGIPAEDLAFEMNRWRLPSIGRERFALGV